MALQTDEEVAVLSLESLSEADELQVVSSPPRHSRHRMKVTALGLGALALCGCIALRGGTSRLALANPFGLLQAVEQPEVDKATKDDVTCHDSCTQTKEKCLDKCEATFPPAEHKQAHMACGYKCGTAWMTCSEVCDKVDVDETSEEVEETEIKTLKAEEETETEDMKASTEEQIKDIEAEEEKQEEDKDALAKDEPEVVVEADK